MNDLTKFLVESILLEADSVDNKVVVYSGRFQPFHKGHYATYLHLVKKFGKDNVYIATSDKTDTQKSPFNFKEKVMVITTMFGVPKNKIVQVKNPYRPTEIIGKFNEDTTAFITVVGEKDASRLGGKYFTPYKDNLELEGYRDKGYVYIAPSQSNPISGTEVRMGLQRGSIEDKKKFFTKRAYPKFNEKIFNFIVNKLSNLSEMGDLRMRISKEIIENWLVDNLDLIVEASKILGTTSSADDGPIFIFPSYNTFDSVSKERAEQIGYTVLSQIMSDELTDIDPYPIYPKGPVKAVTPFPAGVFGKSTANNQEDFYSTVAYTKWYNHVTKVAGLVGYSLVDYANKSVDKVQSTKYLKGLSNESVTGAQKTVAGGVINEIPMADLIKIDNYADKKLDPISVVLTDKHFFDRLTDPRNKKEITQAELIGFFKRLAKRKNEFINFLNLYGQVVAKDNRTKLNIPFMKKANKAIAKTIMRKDDFKTPSPEYKFEDIAEIAPHGYPDQQWIDNHNKKLKKLRAQFDKELTGEIYNSNTIGNGLVKEDTIKHISKSLGISREDMPQINSKDVGDFVKYLKRKGIGVSTSTISVSKIGMVQRNLNVDKIKSMLGIAKSSLSKPVIISKDNYILDGHHRVAALYNLDDNFKLKTIKVDLGIGDLLKVAKEFPKVSYKNIHESSSIATLGGGNNSARWTPPGKSKKLNFAQLSGYIQTKFPIADEMDISNESDGEISVSTTAKYNNKVRANRDENGNLVFENIQNSTNPLDNRTLLLEGGAYGHMNHPFDVDINLTFGQLKDIVKKALTGELQLTREKTDGQALAVSWVNGRLVAARNKGHLKNKGKDAMDINAVASKFAGRGGLTDAYNFAMKDLSAAIDKLSQKQKDKIFGDGSKFMNLEVIYPESVNVIPYGQALLVFHGTMEYDINGNAIGEDASAGRILAGMIKQINQNVQSKYTIQGPPVVKLPKNVELRKLQPKYIGMISKLQSEFGLKDNQGVSEYHQKWWEDFINKNAPNLDTQHKIGLVKRWAFGDKSFRIANINDDRIQKWADKVDKQDHKKITKENLMKFERIFLGVGADVLSFMKSVLTVNPNKAKRAMVARIEKTINDVEAKGDEKQIEKLRLELQRLNDVGGFEKIVPNEGIVFDYNGFTMKLTGSFASLNQLLGIFFDNR
jgi:hypothetical protein